MHPMYDLTAMTGKEAAEQRTVVIGTVELNWRLWIIFIAATPVALFVGAISWVFIGTLAIFSIPITLGLAAWLFYARSADGLRLRTYRSLWDRRANQVVGKFILCGQVVETSLSQFHRGVGYTAPVAGGPAGEMMTFLPLPDDDDGGSASWEPEPEVAAPVFDAFADSGISGEHREAIREAAV